MSVYDGKSEKTENYCKTCGLLLNPEFNLKSFCSDVCKLDYKRYNNGKHKA